MILAYGDEFFTMRRNISTAIWLSRPRESRRKHWMVDGGIYDCRFDSVSVNAYMLCEY